MMRILVTGATGFIGGHIIQALREDNHEIVAVVRNPAAVERRFPDIEAVALDFSILKSVDDCLQVLKDIDVVINSVGIIRETRNQSFEQLHYTAPCCLFQASRLAEVKKIIQISALGADADAFSEYHLSKKSADDCLKALNSDWIIIKPSLVYGPGGKSAAFFKALAALPLLPLVDDGQQAIQPIYIDDLVEAVCRLAVNGESTRLEIDAVGPQPISFRDMLLKYRSWLGKGADLFLTVPYPVALFAARFGGFLGNTPMSGEAVQMLQRGNTGDVSTLTNSTGILPIAFETALRKTPAEQADRWHAHLYLLSPLLRLSIGLLWLVTGITSALFYPVEQSYALLSQVGITGLPAPIALYSASILDIGLGIATLIRYQIRIVGLIQISLILAYSILISIGPTEMWLHPFGPITKNVPLVVATLMMMSMDQK